MLTSIPYSTIACRPDRCDGIGTYDRIGGTSHNCACSMVSAFAYIRPVAMQPCVEQGCASLAVCKPTVRRAARVGDIVVAYEYPKGRKEHRLAQHPQVAFAGRVARKIAMEEYMGHERRDSRIYRSDGTRSGVETPYDSMHWTWNNLTPDEVVERDWSGKYVLLFDEYMDRNRPGPIDIERSRTWPPWFHSVVANSPFQPGDASRRSHRRGRFHAATVQLEWNRRKRQPLRPTGTHNRSRIL